MKHVSRITLYALALALLPLLVCGCSLLDQHAKEFDVMRGLASQASGSLKEGTFAQYQVSGQGLNPGIALEAAIVYRATARYEGLAGQFGASAAGQSNGGALTETSKDLMSATDRESVMALVNKIVAAKLAAQPTPTGGATSTGASAPASVPTPQPTSQPAPP